MRHSTFKGPRVSLLRSVAPFYLAAGLTLLGCSPGRELNCKSPILAEYSTFNDSPRDIVPQDYIAYLKSNTFTHGELDNLPRCAVILHYADMDKFLGLLGYQPTEWTEIATGTTDPNLLYVVRPKSGNSFIVNRGLPGAGGIATQAAELGALGVKSIVHVGTCGFLGESLHAESLVISAGSYKDGAAVLLSDYVDGRVLRIAMPDGLLVQRLRTTLGREGLPFQDAVGYTIPIFYFQPSSLIRHLIKGRLESNKLRPAYVEMEEAPFFETCHRMNIRGASIVVGSDRYTLANGELKHDWLGDTDETMRRAVTASVKALQEIKEE